MVLGGGLFPTFLQTITYARCCEKESLGAREVYGVAASWGTPCGKQKGARYKAVTLNGINTVDSPKTV